MTGNSPVGAVMVVGGGVGGIQAALDLADAGFKVHLVETQSAIGGHMAQLDKTFPTNDCAMCIVSPKLVEAGRHLNIDIHTYADVVSLEGDPGHFSATLKHRARYIDVDKCTGCGECQQVCPVILPARVNVYEEGLADRRAAFRLYPQAVPNAFVIDKKGISPCRDACPTGQRAQGYIALIHESRYEDAMRVIKEDNPFPGICGRICNHRCEDACNRALVDEPVDIRALKRFVTDKIYAQPRVPPEPFTVTRDQRVAIIGAGPCGLTSAQDLVRLGYPVTVFESLPVAGGMLRVGVPEYRLPTEIIEREIADIVDLGVDLRLDHPVNDLDQLFAQGYQAVLVAVGAHEGIRLPIPGADLDGVIINTIFLRDVRLGKIPELGSTVVVVGAGDVAMDVARTARRLGSDVHVHYRRSRAEATAGEEEIRHAVEEGVDFNFLSNPIEVLSTTDGRVAAVRCVRMELGPPDASGRPRPVPVEGSEYDVPCDTVIFSVGQRAGLAFIPVDAGVELTRDGRIVVDEDTLTTTRPGVFAGGDAVRGTAFVIDSVASGHRAAESIHRYLQGLPLESPAGPELPVVHLTPEDVQGLVRRGEVHMTPRQGVPEVSAADRLNTFEEVSCGYSDELAKAEAARCLACGLCSECLSCQYACGADAINHDMIDHMETLEIGAVIMAPGYQTYDPRLSQELGFGRYPNVITAMQFERLLSASGPTFGHVKRPSDHCTPKKIAFLQCVGSRDLEHEYCSSICCMYATKEAIMACEHEPDTQVTIFMMDMRAFSKGYLEYYQRAQSKYGIEYVRCRVSELRENPVSRNVIVRHALEAAAGNGHPGGTLKEEEFDLVVLSVGAELSPGIRELGQHLGIEQDAHGFCQVSPFDPLRTSREGVYACGPVVEPKDIPETVTEASGAAACAAMLLAPARGQLVADAVYPPERDISQEEPRIGVFVCHCGSNIAGFVDVESVEAYAATLPHVVHAERNLYTCSQDSITHITEQIEEHGLNRVIVAACTPLTHEPLFRESLRMAGLNPYLFEMANIRNQCSWVHSHDLEGASSKARDLVRMAVARAARLQPLQRVSIPVQKRALVIGGGIAGMTAALSLAAQGFPVDLVEREAQLGGNLHNVLLSAEGEDPQAFLRDTIVRVLSDPEIQVHLRTEVVEHGGYRGNFSSRLRGLTEDGMVQELELRHGATVVATGGKEYRGDEHLHGQHPGVLSGQEFERLLADHREETLPDEVVMILCVGPAEQYCSRICCTTALKNAISLKKARPDARVTVLYRDIRTYGFKERFYTEARRLGVLFSHYDDDHRPEVQEQNGGIVVKAWESTFGRWMELRPNLVVLSNPMVPQDDAAALATLLKVPRDLDGFFLEAHVKLRPVDFATDGIYLAGVAHYPKFIGEAVSQAQAAAARAATILSKDTLSVGGVVAQVNAGLCTACLTCVRVCPYEVPRINHALIGVGGIAGAAEIEVAQCQGCGICVAECPARAISLMHFTDDQMEVKIEALLPQQLLVSV